MNGADRDPGPSYTTNQVIDRIAAVDHLQVERDQRMREASSDIALQLRIAREFALLDQRELALKSGIDTSLVAAIEDGTHDPTSSTLTKLGIALGIDFVIGASSAA